MTTSDLWPVIASAAVPTSLLDIATVEGFQANNRGLRTLVIGDNISAVAHALDPFDPPGPTGQRPVLQTLFHQLSQFLLAPVTMVFIFDGPGCPGYSAMGLEEVLKTMITAFGFHYYEAPGAAEAELAQLNKAGEIDAILSGDSDAFLYGAQCVIRPSGPSVEDVALIYTVECIENSEPALTRDGLLLFALLLSIDTDGDMKDAGMYGVVSQRFGVDLVEVLATCGGGSVLNRRLDLWRIHLRRELGTASCKSLNEAHSRLAGRIPDTFPNLRVAESYLNPLTSRSPGFTGPLPEVERWQPRDPCIPDVAAFCALRLGWTGHDLLKRLNSALWPGILFRLISSSYVLYDHRTKKLSSPSTKANILASFPPRRDDAASDLELYRVRASTDNFTALAGLQALPQTVETDIKLVSVPKVILAVATRDTSLPHTDLTLVAVSDSSSAQEPGISGDSSEDEGGYCNIVDLTRVDEEELVSAHRILMGEGLIDLTDYE